MVYFSKLPLETAELELCCITRKVRGKGVELKIGQGRLDDRLFEAWYLDCPVLSLRKELYKFNLETFDLHW